MILDRKEISPFGTNEEGQREKGLGRGSSPLSAPNRQLTASPEERTIKL